MIKLENLEDNQIIYVDIMSYYDAHERLNEEILKQDDIIKKHNKYKDPVETRLNLLSYLKPIADNLENSYDFIVSCTTSSSPERIKKSLSNYIDIEFIHPKNVPEDIVKKLYTYTIRYSDHENKHPDHKIDKEVPIVGMKPKNFEKQLVRFSSLNYQRYRERLRSMRLKPLVNN